MNDRSYYRWILSLLSEPSRVDLNIKYTPGHSDDKSTEAQVNSEADYLASSTQKIFRDLPEAPPPTFHMNDYERVHVPSPDRRMDGVNRIPICQHTHGSPIRNSTASQ
ncbi:hypothetical protein BDZ97DRAFT_641851 [Flammula alnicola]|nr:hypothetical protein BDZ97DRAFT_641851 [Flammula alnicola]